MEIVVNCTYGGFGLSEEVIRRVTLLIKGSYFLPRGWPLSPSEMLSLHRPGGRKLTREQEMKVRHFFDGNDNRSHPALVEVVRAVLKEGMDPAWGSAELRIVKVPEGHEYIISDYDGVESVIVGNNLRYLNHADFDPLEYEDKEDE